MASKSLINCCFEKSLCDNPLKTSILNDYSFMNYNKKKRSIFRKFHRLSLVLFNL